MLPISKDNLVIIGVIVCFLGIFYLYREISKLKKTSTVKSSPIATVYPNWAPTPVNEAKNTPPPPQPTVPPVVTPVQARSTPEQPEQ